MAHQLPTALKHDIGDIGIPAEALPPFDAGPIDVHALWFNLSPDQARVRPLELEIGSGKGTFLVQQAPKHPDVDYIGMEYVKGYWRHSADRFRRHGLQNVRMLHAEAGFFVRNYLMDESLRQIHIYFPDPWPKKKQQKRRLIQAPFLRACHRVLEPDGLIRLATDHADYFSWMEAHAEQVNDVFERLPFESPDAAEAGELVGTNFERKYREEGRVFQGMMLRKRSA